MMTAVFPSLASWSTGLTEIPRVTPEKVRSWKQVSQGVRVMAPGAAATLHSFGRHHPKVLRRKEKPVPEKRGARQVIGSEAKVSSRENRSCHTPGIGDRKKPLAGEFDNRPAATSPRTARSCCDSLAACHG